jgi:hypothetical protein
MYYVSMLLHQVINLKSLLHMVKIDYHNQCVIVLYNEMSSSIIYYEQTFINYKNLCLRFFCMIITLLTMNTNL